MDKPCPKELGDDVMAVTRRGEGPHEQVARGFGISEATLVQLAQGR